MITYNRSAVARKPRKVEDLTPEQRAQGEMIKAARPRKMSAEKAAEAVKVSATAIYNYEQGFYLPEPDVLLRLADAYGVTPEKMGLGIKSGKTIQIGASPERPAERPNQVGADILLERYVPVPLWQSAGIPGLWQPPAPSEPSFEIPQSALGNWSGIALKVGKEDQTVGSRLPNGGWVVVAYESEVPAGYITACMNEGNLKILGYDVSGALYGIGSQANLPVFSLEEWSPFGRVIAFIRNFGPLSFSGDIELGGFGYTR